VIASDATWLSQRFEACGDVDAVAEDITVFADDVANIDADSKRDMLVGRNLGVAAGRAALDLERAAHGFHDARELSEKAVPGLLDEGPCVCGDGRLDNLVAQRRNAHMRAFLVATGAGVVLPRTPRGRHEALRAAIAA